MSSESPREKASAEVARSQTDLNLRLGDTSLPALQKMLDLIRSDIGDGGIPKSIGDQFNAIRADTNRDFDKAARDNPLVIDQMARQSGGAYTSAQLDALKANAALSLDRARDVSMQNLKFQEAQAGMTQYNTLMNLMGVGAGQALRMGQGFTGAQVGAIGGMSGQSEAGGALSGAMAGASLGTSISPGWGTVIGAGVGALGGWLTSR